MLRGNVAAMQVCSTACRLFSTHNTITSAESANYSLLEMCTKFEYSDRRYCMQMLRTAYIYIAYLYVMRDSMAIDIVAKTANINVKNFSV